MLLSSCLHLDERVGETGWWDWMWRIALWFTQVIAFFLNLKRHFSLDVVPFVVVVICCILKAILCCFSGKFRLHVAPGRHERFASCGDPSFLNRCRIFFEVILRIVFIFPHLCVLYFLSLFWLDLTRCAALLIAMEFCGVSCSVWFYVQHRRLLQEIVPYSTKCGFIVNKLFISKKIDHSLTSCMVLDLFELNFIVSPSAGVSNIHSVLYSYWGKWFKFVHIFYRYFISNHSFVYFVCFIVILVRFYAICSLFIAILRWNLGAFHARFDLRATWTATSGNRSLFD